MDKKRLLSLLILGILLIGPALSCRPLLGPRETPTPTRESLPPTHPLLLERSPARGEEAPLDRSLILVFDQPMDPASVEAAFSIDPPVEGTFSWQDPATLVFTPLSNWERATRYRVRLDTTARSADGLPLREETEFTFATVGYLEVTQVIPEPGMTEVEPTAAVTVMFNRPVVPLQLVSAPSAEMPTPVQFDPPVEGSGEWINTSIYIFRPSTGFIPSQTYRATIQAGLTDTTGGILQESFSWEFTIQSPYVLQTVPASDEGQVPITRPITVTFSQPMDPASTEAAFSLRTEDGEAVPGRFSWDDAHTTMTFFPEGRLELGIRYEATVAGTARAAVGNATLREAYSWLFYTVPFPSILRTNPRDRTTVDPSTSFDIYFSAPMDVATLMPNITILPEPTGVYTWWDEYENRFSIVWNVEPSTPYEVRLGGGMADLYGNTIGEEQVVRFTTTPLSPMAYLVAPGNIGTYNAYTPTQIYLAHRNVTQVDLALYRLDWEDFVDLTGPNRWELWDRFNPDREAELMRSWTLTLEAPLNEIRYKLVDLAEDGGPLPPGLYFLQASAPEVQILGENPSRRLLVVSPLHVMLKLAQREALVWVTDLMTGRPVAGAPVLILGPNGQMIRQGTTDSDGVFRAEFRPLEDLWVPYTARVGSPRERVFGVAVSDWYDGISPWDFDLSADFLPPPYRLYLYTERPIYRPGQPVYFRGVIRAEDDVHFSLPPAIRSVPIAVYNDQGEQIYSDILPLSDFGTFNGQFTLGEEAGLGYYYIEAKVSGQSQGVGFQVAEYRRPEFEVSVTADKEEYLTGERVNAVVESTYFFGGPVANASVHWTLLAQDYPFRPDVPGWWDWSDTSSWDWWRPPEVPGWGRVVADGDGTTDSRGRFVFSVPADISESQLSQLFTLEATITDINDQSVSNRTSFIVHKGLFYIGLQPQRYVGRVGQEQTVEVRTVDWDGEPVGNVRLGVTYIRREWLNVQEEDEYGNLYWTWVPSDTVVFSQTVTTDREGEATASFIPEEGGSYIVRAEGSDERGNKIVSATWLWVSTSEYVSWRQENSNRIRLVADRRSYRPGDVAQILIPSPFQGEVTALFTVERGRVLRHWVQTLSGNAETVELPITADYAPNVYVSVVLVKGLDETNPVPAYRLGYVSFEVSTEQQELRIEVIPDRDLAAGEHYGPREQVTAEVRVTDANGRPVEAEVGIGVVDKAVFSLAAPNAPSILEAFYGERGLGVRTADSLVFSVDRTNVRVAEEAKGGGGGGPEAALVGAEFIRQEFPDTAFWAPSVRTDATGRATVTFRLPDQLTTWHLDARAVTREALVGQTELDILSTKDLLVRPVTPRFFVAGDQAELGAVVHNNTDRQLEVEVWLDAEGVTLLGEARHTVTLEPGGKARVDWPVEVSEDEAVSAVDLVFHAQGGGLSDAVKPPAGLPPDQRLPVYRYSAPETVGTAGQIDEAGSVLEAVALPPSIDTTQGELTVRIEPSLAAGMTDALSYLEHFPYECTEQLISRFLPNVLTYQALTRLGLEDPELAAKLREQVGIGLQRLYARQHYDGGWGWWVRDQSDPLVTAYVVFGLIKAKEAGFAVSGGAIERGVEYLRGQIGPLTRLKTTTEVNRRAFILYVLTEAGAVRESDLTALYEVRGRLGHHGRAFLAMSLGLLNKEDPRIRTLLSDLNSAAIVSATGARWQETDPDPWNWSTDTRTTAVVLDALARLDPENRLASQAVRWLMHARTGDRWETTQETAWSLIALTDWMVATGELEANYSWGVRLNWEDLGSGRATSENVRETTEFRVAVADLLRGEANRLQIARGEGPGHLYYTAHLHAYLPVEEVRALNRGIIIGRTYEMADCEEQCPSLAEAKVGDRVRVRLTIIAPNDLSYVVVEDPFPAGAEPVDTSLQTTSVVGERPELRRTDVESFWWDWGWGWWWFAEADLRDEKLVLFAPSLPAGTYEYTYLLEMGLPGTYRVLPATAYEMYFPEVMGRSDGMLFRISR